MSKVRIYAKLLENISFYYKDKVYMLIEIMVKQITFIFKWNVHYLPFIFGQIFQENNMQVPVQCIHLLQRFEGILNFLKAMLIILIKILIHKKMNKIQISSCIIQEVYFIFGYQ